MPRRRSRARPSHRRSILTGTLLPGWYDDWVVLERERLGQLQVGALEALSARLCGDGAHGQAVSAGLAAAACEPLRESAHCAVIHAHARAGNLADASRQYQLYRGLLERAGGLAPSPVVDELVKMLGLPLDLKRPGSSRREGSPCLDPSRT